MYVRDDDLSTEPVYVSCRYILKSRRLSLDNNVHISTSCGIFIVKTGKFS